MRKIFFGILIVFSAYPASASASIADWSSGDVKRDEFRYNFSEDHKALSVATKAHITEVVLAFCRHTSGPEPTQTFTRLGHEAVVGGTGGNDNRWIVSARVTVKQPGEDLDSRYGGDDYFLGNDPIYAAPDFWGTCSQDPIIAQQYESIRKQQQVLEDAKRRKSLIIWGLSPLWLPLALVLALVVGSLLMGGRGPDFYGEIRFRR